MTTETLPEFADSIAEMYNGGPGDIGSIPFFGGEGFINYGIWTEPLPRKGHIPDTMRNRASANLYREVLDTISVNSDDNLVELGTGRGSGAEIIQEEYQPFGYTGVDYSFSQLQHTLSRIGHFPDISVARANALVLPFANNHFTAATSVEVIQHINDPLRFFQETFRVLKPNGRFAFCSFFATRDRHILALTQLLPSVQQGVDILHSIEGIKALLQEAGFVKIRNISIGKKVWKPMIRYAIEKGQHWSTVYTNAFKKSLLDYNIITAEKP